MRSVVQAEIGRAGRFLLWTLAAVIGIVAARPEVLELPGSPLFGLFAVVTHLALAHVAVQVTLAAFKGGPERQCPGSSPRWAGWDGAGAVPFALVTHAAAVLLCGVGTLPGDLGGVLPFVSQRSGWVLLGLGVIVLSRFPRPPRRRRRPVRPSPVVEAG